MTKLGDQIGACIGVTRLGDQIGIVTRWGDQIGTNLVIMSPIRSRLVPSVVQLVLNPGQDLGAQVSPRYRQTGVLVCHIVWLLADNVTDGMLPGDTIL
jgi:hypothetical protein